MLDAEDRNHDRARLIRASIATSRNFLVTSNFIIAETHALLLNRLGYKVALAFVDGLAHSALEILQVTPEDEESAVRVIRQYQDKHFSYTDATCFAIMERLRIEHAFTFDRNFAQYGLRQLEPTDPPL